MGSRDGARRTFIVLILVALALVLALALPFGAGFVFAAVLAGALGPLHRKLTLLLRERPTLAASLLTLGVLLLVLLPLGGFGAFMIAELVNGTKFIAETLRSEDMNALLARLPQPLHDWAQELIRTAFGDASKLSEAVTRQAGAYTGEVARAVTRAVSATGSAVVQITMSLIAFFFLLIDGPALVSWMAESSPLMPGQMRELLAEFRRVSTAVLVSSLVTSGVQALVALAGYIVAGVPQPVFFGLLTFFVAFVPAVGAGGVCLLAALLVLALGHGWAALFLALWGLVVVSLVDNWVKPLLVQRGMHMHGAVVFFALIGGISVFGAVGLLVGPLIVTFLVALVRIYRRDFPDPAC
jgi:predicted PurR-regulated permease PerM